MAQDDRIFFSGSIASGAYLDLQMPASGTEGIITNINHEDAIQLFFYDGTNSIPSLAIGDASPLMQVNLNVSYNKYYRVKNLAATAKLISADGVQTK